MADGPERTPDGRYIVVDGRRWRASDPARAVGGEGWRAQMDLTRDVARELARAGEVEITQKGRALDPDEPWRGPVRIRARARP